MRAPLLRNSGGRGAAARRWQLGNNTKTRLCRLTADRIWLAALSVVALAALGVGGFALYRTYTAIIAPTQPPPLSTTVYTLEAFVHHHVTGEDYVDIRQNRILVSSDGDGNASATTAHNCTELYVAGLSGYIDAFSLHSGVRRFYDGSSLGVVADNEVGFKSFAFHPRYAENGRLFVAYSKRDDGGVGAVNTVSELRTVDVPPRCGAGVVDPASERVLLRWAQPAARQHNAAALMFNDADADNNNTGTWLYVGAGDGDVQGGPLRNAQRTARHSGGIMRIDVDCDAATSTPVTDDTADGGGAYCVPRANPYAGSEAATAAATFHKGLRNAWRFSFDGRFNRLWLGDVGGDLYEEVSMSDASTPTNFGWPDFESYDATPAAQPCGATDAAIVCPPTMPVFRYGHNVGQAIVGGHVYRGRRNPSLVDHYVFADYTSSKIFAMQLVPATGLPATDAAGGAIVTTIVAANSGGITSIGVDNCGELYFANSVFGVQRLAVDAGVNVQALYSCIGSEADHAVGGAPP